MRPLDRIIPSTLAALLILLPGCDGSDSRKPDPTLVIASLGWIEESIDPTFWTTPPPGGQTAFYDFWIHYTGEVAYGDIEYARVYEPNGRYYWTINRGTAYFSAANRTIGGYGRWYGSPANLLPIGPMHVEVKLTNGRVATYTSTIPAPASLVAGTTTSMYSEDLLSPPAGSAPMILRATAGATNTLTASTQTLVISFSVVDARVYSGFVWLYDAAGLYLGGFFHFRDLWTGAVRSQLAGNLHTDGTVNVLTLQPVDLQLNAGATFDQIEMVRVVLTDGSQYAPQTTGRLRYDCRSVAAVTSLTLQ